MDLNESVQDGATPIDVPVQNVTVHPQYSTNPMINDIALIRLQNPARFTSTYFTCVPIPNYQHNYTQTLPCLLPLHPAAPVYAMNEILKEKGEGFKQFINFSVIRSCLLILKLTIFSDNIPCLIDNDRQCMALKRSPGVLQSSGLKYEGKFSPIRDQVLLYSFEK